MQHVILPPHALKQMAERGASKKEVVETISTGEVNVVKHGRIAYRKNFQYNDKWGGKFYHIKQVMPIAKKELNRTIVITVYTFYF